MKIAIWFLTLFFFQIACRLSLSHAEMEISPIGELGLLGSNMLVTDASFICLYVTPSEFKYKIVFNYVRQGVFEEKKTLTLSVRYKVLQI